MGMNPRVSVPKIFLRGNRWYVRVQVPRSMQDRLGRREYWVSLRTSDRSVAMQRAATAAQRKRHEVVFAFRLVGGAAEIHGGRSDGATKVALPGVATENTTGKVDPTGPNRAVNIASIRGPDAPTSTPSRSTDKRVRFRKTATVDLVGKFDGLSKRQLIDLLERQEQEKAFGLVWERNTNQDDAHGDNLVLARIDLGLSEGSAPWENLVIEADNFDALKWLRINHRGRIKCVFVDPPYGTGSTTRGYNDRFTRGNEKFRQSAWLEYLHRRLLIAPDLLTEDGVIMVTINDENRSLLELLMRKALPGMRIGSLVWRTRNGSNADQGHFLSPDHEHILVASRNGFSFAGTERSYVTYTNPDDDPRGDWQPVPMKLGYSRHERPNLFYPLFDPKTGIHYPCDPDSVWRFAMRDRVSKRSRIRTQPVEDFIDQDRILFPVNQRVESFDTIDSLRDAIDRGDVPKSGRVPMLRHDLPDLEFWVGKRIGYGTPCRKLFRSELRRPTKPLSSWVSGYSERETYAVDDNQIIAGSYTEGSRDVRSIFQTKAFNHPKPVSLVRELLRQTTGPGDLVLDLFAGSATTAHAVMELNAEDGMDRRFIMVSSTEATKDHPSKNLCRDVTAERIRLLNASTDPKYDGVVAGFAYLRTERIPIAHLDLALDPAAAWTSLEALRGLPLTPYDPDLPWNSHETAEFALVMVDRYEPALLDWLQTRQSPIHIYTWAKGRLQEHLAGPGIQVSLVEQTLVDAFTG
jgi:adenine-specific DNA-methyltransferase